MSGDNDDLNVIASEPRPPVLFMGRAVEVRPLTVGQIPAITRVLRGVNIQAVFTGDKIADIDFMGLVADHGDQMIGAVAIASGMKSDEVAQAAPDEFIELARAIIEVNSDFFIQKVVPQIMASINGASAFLQARTAAAGIGETPSKP
jgi:hypothetical protein